MLKTKILLPALILSFSWINCASIAETDRVVGEFLAAYDTGDYKKITPFLTLELKGELPEKKYKDSFYFMSKYYGKLKSRNRTSFSIRNDTARLKYSLSYEKQECRGFFRLIKRQEKWQLDEFQIKKVK